MSLDVGDAPRVVDGAVVAAVGVRGSVLGHVERRRVVFVVEPDEQLVEAVRVDLPAHVGALHVVALDGRGAAVLAVRPYDAPRVVVHAEEVEGRRDRLQIPVGDRRQDRREVVEHVLGICPAQHGVENPAVPVPVGARERLEIAVRVGQRMEGDEIDRDADAGAGGLAAEHVRREAVGEENVVGGGERVGVALPAGRVLARSVAEPADDPGLALRDPVANAVAEAGRDDLDVLGEGLGRVAHGPAAAVLERLRQVPVVERRERLDAARRAARPRAGRSSRGRACSWGRALPGRCEARRSRSDTRSGRGPA